MRRVLVYVNQPLPISETFVYNQIVRLRRYSAYVLGSRLPKGPAISLAEKPLFLLNSGGISGQVREWSYKLLGHVPPDVLAWIREANPVLLHAHFGPYGAIALPLAKRLGLPLVVSFHGTDATLKPLWVLRKSHMAHRLYLLRKKRLAQEASRIIVPSEFLRNIVTKRHGFPEDKVIVIRHGVDVTKFTYAGDGWEWGHILYVGRLIELKGLGYLLQALGRVIRQQPQIRLTVIGDGPMRQKYEGLARAILGERVAFLGAQSQEVVAVYMRRAHLFSMPSVTMPSGAAEALGMVFLEAMASGVPVVSFRSGAIPEVVQHGITGFLAEERNVDQLARYILMLLEDPGLRVEMGARGRKWVEAEYDMEKQIRKLEDLYDSIVTEVVT